MSVVVTNVAPVVHGKGLGLVDPVDSSARHDLIVIGSCAMHSRACVAGTSATPLRTRRPLSTWRR